MERGVKRQGEKEAIDIKKNKKHLVLNSRVDRSLLIASSPGPPTQATKIRMKPNCLHTLVVNTQAGHRSSGKPRE